MSTLLSVLQYSRISNIEWLARVYREHTWEQDVHSRAPMWPRANSARSGHEARSADRIPRPRDALQTPTGTRTGVRWAAWVYRANRASPADTNCYADAEPVLCSWAWWFSTARVSRCRWPPRSWARRAAPVWPTAATRSPCGRTQSADACKRAPAFPCPCASLQSTFYQSRVTITSAHIRMYAM